MLPADMNAERKAFVLHEPEKWVVFFFKIKKVFKSKFGRIRERERWTRERELPSAGSFPGWPRD